MAGDHLITDEESRRIVEAFLSTAQWAGDIVWGRAWIADQSGDVSTPSDLIYKSPEGDRESWQVAFRDPSGEVQQFDHEEVLKGLRAVVYGEVPDGPESLDVHLIRHWYSSPAEERRAAGLDATRSSYVCQRALYGQKVFPTEQDLALFGSFRTSNG